MRFRVTRASADDLDILVSHRLKMWADIRPQAKSKVRDHEGVTRSWIRAKLAEGKLVGFIVRAPHGGVAGSGCVWVREEQPRPGSPGLEVPYLMSMYTEKPYRRKGVAKLVVKGALRWCRDHKFETVVLHASREGRPLYESLGFEPTSEMRRKLRPARSHRGSSRSSPMGGTFFLQRSDE